MKILSTILITVIITGCQSNTEKEFTGKWFMYKVIQDGADVTSEHDPFDERFLILREDSTFESGGRPFGRNTGKYLYNSGDKTLFLDSDVGPDDDSYWKVLIRGDTMHWQGYGSEWAEGFELIHIKKKE